MTMARRQLIDISLTRWYHCVSRCVRHAFLLSEGKINRKQWVEVRLNCRELAGSDGKTAEGSIVRPLLCRQP
jgi:hypothetical protein